MSFTDILAVICAVFLFWKGFLRGFLGSLIGPVALILGSLISFGYYFWTKQLVISLCIGLFGPFLLDFLFRFILRSWNALSSSGKDIHLISRLSGALLSFSWGMTLFVITLFLLLIVPPLNKPLEFLTHDIRTSLVYTALKPLDPMAVKPSSSHPSTATSKDNIQALSEDKRIQDILHDPVITDAINRKDYAFLMSNKKIMDLMQDPEIIKKMMAAYKDLAEVNKKEAESTKKETEVTTK